MRKVFNADFDWKFAVEDKDEQKRASYSHSQAYNSVKMGGADGFASVKYNDENWRKVNLPHDRRVEAAFTFKGCCSRGSKKDETVWYRKTFVLDKETENKHVLLVLEGISPCGEVYFNGSKTADVQSSYAETAVDLTTRIHTGTDLNILAVKVPGVNFEGWWYDGIGIYRHVRLYIKEMLHIAHNGLWIKPVKEEDGKWSIYAQTTVENSAYESDRFELEVRILDREGRQIAVKRKKGTIGADEQADILNRMSVENPMLWDVEDPVLYTAEVRILKEGELVDCDRVRFGFRTAVFDAQKGFLLNGRQVKLKGVCNHQDHAGVGVAVPDAIQYYRISRLKEMGANALRTAHNFPAKEVLDACDEYGILVIDENRRLETISSNLDQLKTMIKRDRNHPSIILWSLFNEESRQGTLEGARVFCKLQSLVKKLDDSRPTTGAMQFGWFEEEGAALKMDVTGINYNLQVIEQFHEKYPDQPFVCSENNSALTIRGEVKKRPEKHILNDYDDYATNWGSTMQECWEKVHDKDYVSGIFIWTGFDYRGEPTPFEYPTISSLFGVMDTCGFAKTQYYVCQACFRSEPMMHIFPHWNHKAGEAVSVMTVTNCTEVELFLNGRSLGRKESLPYRQCLWEVPFEKGELIAIGYQDGKETARDVVRTASKPVKILAQAHKSVVTNDGTDAVAVNVWVVDSQGNPVADASDTMQFTAEGGRILGVGNGNPNSHEPDWADHRKLFHGKCQAIVAVDQGTDTFRVNVRSEGLESAEVLCSIRNETEKTEILYSTENKAADDWLMSVKAYSRRPNPNMKIADTDMNDFVPVKVLSMNSQYLEKGWYLYRTFLSLPEKEIEYRVSFFIQEIKCDACELWVNGKMVYEDDRKEEKRTIDVSFDPEGKRDFEITLLLKTPGGEGGIAGKGRIVSLKASRK